MPMTNEELWAKMQGRFDRLDQTQELANQEARLLAERVTRLENRTSGLPDRSPSSVSITVPSVGRLGIHGTLAMWLTFGVAIVVVVLWIGWKLHTGSAS